VVGEAALSFIRQFKVDIGLIGISGIDADGTLRDFDMREVMVARAIVEQSRQVWLVADHSKFGRAAMIEMAPLKALHTLFTDAPLSADFERLLRDQAVRCVVAPSPEALTDTPPEALTDTALETSAHTFTHTP
jgi:DeoR family glycerol-3-phosphate regulon repressor